MLTTRKSRSGGMRPGAGRPKGSGKFKENTRPIRVPERLLPQIENMLDFYVEHLAQSKMQSEYENDIFQPEFKTQHALPFYASRVAAGFPSPADDYIEAKLDLNQHLIKHPAATFFVRVSGNSMTGAGIFENDILVVDRSLKPSHGKVVIAVINGELTVKRLNILKDKVSLRPENEDYHPIDVSEDMEFSIWGVVTSVIHAV